MSKVSVQRYVLASMSGMLPSQGLHVYIGSTLRSMEEVISSSPSSTLAYVVFGAQVGLLCAEDWQFLRRLLVIQYNLRFTCNNLQTY